ncbi:MAG: SAM-dependent methyltransferase [Proteobacteria bacterium]|nr:MAG: SAM-dependent methyltransferase [Pseudomonadota bacterium]
MSSQELSQGGRQNGRTNTGSLERKLEQELMVDPAHVRAYAQADFEAAHQAVVDWITERYGELAPGTSVLDIGCGPGDVTRRLLKAQPAIDVIAVDGSRPMLDLAQRLTQEAGLAARVNYVQALIHELPSKMQFIQVDLAICTSVLHHLSDPQILWSTLSEMRQGTRPLEVVVTDLIRPETESIAIATVERLAEKERPELKQDFFNSLCAAFTLDEVRTQLARAGQEALRVEAMDELHLIVSGEVS